MQTSEPETVAKPKRSFVSYLRERIDMPVAFSVAVYLTAIHMVIQLYIDNPSRTYASVTLTLMIIIFVVGRAKKRKAKKLAIAIDLESREQIQEAIKAAHKKTSGYPRWVVILVGIYIAWVILSEFGLIS